MTIENEINDKTKNQLLEKYYNSHQGGKANELYKMAIIAQCTNDIEKALKSLEDSIDKNSKSGADLSKKIFCLNFILAIATTVVAVVSVIQLFCDAL